MNYTVLTGDFNKSVALAQEYASEGFGRYNFLYHNCCDYTNELLDVADIDGMLSQFASEGNLLISIPVLREFELSVMGDLDSVISWPSNALIDLGDSISGHNRVGDIVGGILGGIGKLNNASRNFAADVVDIFTGASGEVLDVVKGINSAVTNGAIDVGTYIKDGAVSLWENLFG